MYGSNHQSGGLSYPELRGSLVTKLPSRRGVTTTTLNRSVLKTNKCNKSLLNNQQPMIYGRTEKHSSGLCHDFSEFSCRHMALGDSIDHRGFFAVEYVTPSSLNKYVDSPSGECRCQALCNPGACIPRPPDSPRGWRCFRPVALTVTVNVGTLPHAHPFRPIIAPPGFVGTRRIDVSWELHVPHGFSSQRIAVAGVLPGPAR